MAKYDLKWRSEWDIITMMGRLFLFKGHVLNLKVCLRVKAMSATRAISMAKCAQLMKWTW